MTWYEAYGQIERRMELAMPDFGNEIYAESDQQEPKAQPHVPESLQKIVCSDRPMTEKRDAIDECISTDPDFVAWVLYAMHVIEGIPKEFMGVQAEGLGYCIWDGENFRDMTSALLNQGYLPLTDLRYCQGARGKQPKSYELIERTHLGKHGEQIIASIALTAGCPWHVPPRIARKMGIDTARERKKHFRSQIQAFLRKKEDERSVKRLALEKVAEVGERAI